MGQQIGQYHVERSSILYFDRWRQRRGSPAGSRPTAAEKLRMRSAHEGWMEIGARGRPPSGLPTLPAARGHAWINVQRWLT
jgi:hypothetical protein